MAADPYDVMQALQRAAIFRRNAGSNARGIAGLAQQVAAGNTGGMRNTGRSSGGGGGYGGAAPVTTLASMAASNPVVADLLKKGILKEGMAPEQIQAILAISQMAGTVPVDIAEMIAKINADYESTTGDIMGSGAEWMKELYGTNYDPNDPNAAAFARDPLFSSYAGGLAQMDETADTNQATDLAWFRKQEQAQQDYYNQLMADVSTYGLPAQEVTGGSGGGGGGGGGYGGGGSGGGSSGSDSEGLWDFNDADVRFQDQATTTATSNVREYDPGFWLGALQMPGLSDEDREFINNMIWTHGPGPQDVGQGITEEFTNNVADIELGNLGIMNNTIWNQGAAADFDSQMMQYMQQANLADNPETEAVEHFYHPEGGLQRGEEPIFGSPEEREYYLQQQALYEQAYLPVNQSINVPRAQQYLDEVGSVEDVRNSVLPGNTVNSVTSPIPATMPTINQGAGIPEGMSPEDVLGITPEYTPPLSDLPSAPPGATAPASEAEMTTEEYAASLNEALESARRYVGDDNALSYYWDDTFPTLSRGQQAAVLNMFASEGVDVPLQYQEAVSDTVLSPEALASQALQTAMQGAQEEQSQIPQNIARRIQEGQRVAQHLVANIQNEFGPELNEPIQWGGTLRNDLLTAMQEFSDEQRRRAREIFNGTTEEFEQEIDPGDYYQDDAMTPDEVVEIEHENQLIEQLRDFAQTNNANFQATLVQNYLLDQERQQQTNAVSSDTEDPALSAQVIGPGDLNYVDPADLQIVEPSPDNYGGFGESAGRSYRSPLVDWTPPAPAAFNADKIINQPVMRTQSNPKPAGGNIQLIAAKRLADALKNATRKVSPPRFGKF